jgi:hypothetical protein
VVADHRQGLELAGAAAYFGLLGVGFMLVEIALAHKLTFYLGYPVLSLSVVLFSLLAGGATGSLRSQSWPEARLSARVVAAAVAVAGASLALSGGLDKLLSSTLAWPILPRSLLAMAVLLPLGFALGMPFPSGLRVIGAWSPTLVPWAWALNGMLSVAGSTLAMAGGKLCGFSGVLTAAAGVYLVVAAMALAQGRRASRPSKETEP